MKNKEQIIKIVRIIQYIAMFGFVFGCAYVFFFADDNVCVTLESSQSTFTYYEDEGTKCFRTISEARKYQLYLIEKYDIGKEPTFHYNLSNFTIN